MGMTIRVIGLFDVTYDYKYYSTLLPRWSVKADLKDTLFFPSIFTTDSKFHLYRISTS